MKFNKFKVTVGSVAVYTLLMSGCGGNGGGGSDTTPPEFTSSAQVDVNEDTDLNHTVIATDAGGSVSYSKDGGANEVDFTINATTGVLTFSAPEVIADTNYFVNIKATDPSDNNRTQNITVIVKNVTTADTTAPVFTSSSELNVTENITLNHTVTATDAGGSVSYSKDATTENGTLFTITTAGVLTFNAPAVSADTDYDIKVKATDLAGNPNTQTITVTVKDAGAVTNRAIMPMNTAGIFTRDDTKNTVLNTRTGFVWEDTTDNDDNKTFAQAEAHCLQLKNDGFSGINDWRLPSRADLFKLVDYSSGGGNFMDDEFSNSAGGVYWTNEEENDIAWGVSYAGGSGDFRVTKTLLTGDIRTAYVRCVSGDHQPPQFSGAHNLQTRTDAYTGLEWQTHVHDSIADNDGAYHRDMNWSTAQTTCNNSGFRLPDINELRSIVEYDSGAVFGDVTIDVSGTLFSARSEENGLNGSVWSSTETTDGKIKTLYIVKTGAATIYEKDEIYDTTLEKNASAFDIKAICVK